MLQLLLYHTLDSEARSTDLSDGLTATTLNGEDITITLNPPKINGNSEILVDEGLVDIEASNGQSIFFLHMCSSVVQYHHAN